MRCSLASCPMRTSAPARISSSRPGDRLRKPSVRGSIFWLVSDSRPVDRRAVREIIFDTETTGLNPAGGDRMVEIGCIEIVHRVETGRHFHAYFNPGRPMPREAEAVHGLTDMFLSDKPPFADKVAEL